MLRRLGSFFLDVLEVIVFAVGIFFFVYLLIMRPHKIKGQSMMPNFPDGEFLLTEKVSYYLKPPQRGDVVVLAPPESVSPDEFIKRIIGLPGEKIAVDNGRVYINGSMLKEPYIAGNIYTVNGDFLTEGREYTIPPGEYMVMGDNRPNSSDSRYWGPITKSEITGRAWIIYWPISQIGVVAKPAYAY
jgi:signal peptidase I